MGNSVGDVLVSISYNIDTAYLQYQSDGCQTQPAVYPLVVGQFISNAIKEYQKHTLCTPDAIIIFRYCELVNIDRVRTEISSIQRCNFPIIYIVLSENE